MLLLVVFILLCEARNWKSYHEDRKTAQAAEELHAECEKARLSALMCSSIILDPTVALNRTDADRRRHSSGPKTQKQINQESLKHCPHSREDAIECSRKYVDANHDNYICQEEADAFKSASLYWYEELAIFIFQVGDIMSRCDFDGDGLISEDDFKNSYMSCLKDCSAVMDLFNYGCSRAKANNYVPKPVICSKVTSSDSSSSSNF